MAPIRILLICSAILAPPLYAEHLQRLPEVVESATDESTLAFLPETARLESASPASLTLADAESMAVAASPSLAAMRARVTAARWQCVQAGLPPNPTIGYLASEVGNEGQAGQQGAYAGQQFIRGGKLKYAQAVAAKEVRRREQELAAERLRVLTDVRTVFFEVFLSQRQVELTAQLAELSRRAAETSQRQVEAG
ncbi:MAG: TolC family protein [Planctomycetota bacterium]